MRNPTTLWHTSSGATKLTAKITYDENELRQIYKDSTDKVLVACPTYDGKNYALTAYIEAYNAFVYPYRGLFMVDNTGKGLRYYEHLKAIGVPCAHINPTKDFQTTFTKCWQRILKEALTGGYNWILSVEQDNICPPLTLDVLLNVAGWSQALYVQHGYNWHRNQSTIDKFTGLGCSLIHVDLLKRVFEQKQWLSNAFESEIVLYPRVNNIPTVEVYNILDIKHLDDEKHTEYYMFEDPRIPRMGAKAGEKLPAVNATNPDEDYSAHWRTLKIANETILDLGADYGTTADYFLRMGAKNVVAVESEKEEFGGLFEYGQRNLLVKAVHKKVTTGKDVDALLRRWKPTVVKCDIEGDEKAFLEASPKLLKTIPQYVIETHNSTVENALRCFFQTLGFHVQSFTFKEMTVLSIDQFTVAQQIKPTPK
jgi:predicted RNA methylase